MEYEKKRTLLSELNTFFREALKDGAFSAASIGVQYYGSDEKKHVIKEYYGYTDCLYTSYPVGEATFYDLASLTKPLVTVLLLLTLLEGGKILLDDSLVTLLPDVDVPRDKKDIRLWQLMSHCSGLPAHRLYYTELLGVAPERRKEHVTSAILKEELEYNPSTKHIYSDLGYILLGRIIEYHTGKTLQDSLKEVLQPLGLEKELFFPKPGQLDISGCVVTEICPWSKVKLCGTVHDDNCRILGGQAGHAGLFGTVDGVLGLCDAFCMGWHGNNKKLPVSADILKKITARVGKSTWSCGFDTPTKLYSSSGRYFSNRTIGHLGFTGTSFWIDIERKIEIVFLTNRVCPSRENQRIKRLRPKLHDMIMEKLV